MKKNKNSANYSQFSFASDLQFAKDEGVFIKFLEVAKQALQPDRKLLPSRPKFKNFKTV